MSEKDEENSKSRPNTAEKASQGKPATPRSIKAATHLLKAEALRRLQLPDAEYDGDKKVDAGSSSELPDASLTTNIDDSGAQSAAKALGSEKSDANDSKVSVVKEKDKSVDKNLDSEVDIAGGSYQGEFKTPNGGSSEEHLGSNTLKTDQTISSVSREASQEEQLATVIPSLSTSQVASKTGYGADDGLQGQNMTDIGPSSSYGENKSGKDAIIVQERGSESVSREVVESEKGQRDDISESSKGLKEIVGNSEVSRSFDVSKNKQSEAMTFEGTHSRTSHSEEALKNSEGSKTKTGLTASSGKQNEVMSEEKLKHPTVKSEEFLKNVERENSSNQVSPTITVTTEEQNEETATEASKLATLQSEQFPGNAGRDNTSSEVSPPTSISDQSNDGKQNNSKDLSQVAADTAKSVDSKNEKEKDSNISDAKSTNKAEGLDMVSNETQSMDDNITAKQDSESSSKEKKSGSTTDTSTSEMKSAEIGPGENDPTDGNATPSQEAGKAQTLTQDEKTDPAEEGSLTNEAKEEKSVKDEESSSEAEGDRKKKTLSSRADEDYDGTEEERSDKEEDEEKDEQKVEAEEEIQDSGRTTVSGDQQEVPEDEEKEEEELIPDDFYYTFDELVSKPCVTEGIPQELITLHHSFGFECTKRSNLHVIDENTVLFSAGNSVEILDLQTLEQTHVQSTSGGGIGAIAVHPSRKYFAVAEKGDMPNINIYEFPSLKLYRILREGTEKAYTHLDFNAKGDKLASVGSSPDFMLTVWKWKNEKIILRSKAFSQDVYLVAFAAENEGHLCTTGLGHIRFWTMANTFTGLKLQGEIGKFGTKELSDIEGFVEMPDGKVLSGCEWGNMLLWDGGLIKVEICKKGKKSCHSGMIQQFFMDEGELITIGVDGYIKVWDFESIDSADTTEEGMLFEMDPMYELKVGTDVKLMSMVKAVTDGESPIWFAQDAGGGIWKLDLSFTHTSHAPNKMFSYHAGAITGLDTSPVAHFVATTGVDHTVRVYNFLSKTAICQAKYNSGGSSLLWLPRLVDANGSKILAGFADGVVRLLNLSKLDPSHARTKKLINNYELSLVQAFKPHTKSVTTMAVDDQGEILATGSEDSTIFFFTVGETYKPIGFVETASPVVSLMWSRKGKKSKTVLVSCRDGTVLEVEAPQPGNIDTSKSYHLPLSNLKITEFQFRSIKEKLRKAEEEARKAKEQEEKRKRKEEERRKRRARGLEEEEEEEEEEQEEEEEEEEEKEEEKEERSPPQAIKAFYHGNKETFWLSMDGWDAGYLYECKFEERNKSPPSSPEQDTTGEPIRALPVESSNDVPIRSFCFSRSKKFFLLGMDDGVLRIHPLEKDSDLHHLSNFWSINIHDNHHGNITNIATSFDDKFVFTVGTDGNFFAHKFMDEAVKGLKVPHRVSIPSAKKLLGDEGEEIEKKVDDIDDPNFYSIEMEKQKAEHDRMLRLAEEKKQHVRQAIAKLRRTFKQLLIRNQELPSHVQLFPEEFVIDPEVLRQEEAKTEEKINTVRKEMAWEAEKHAIGLRKLQKRFKDEIGCERIVLRAFQTSHKVSTFRASNRDHLQQVIQDVEENFSRGGEGAEGTRKSGSAKSTGMKRRSTQDKLPVQQQVQQQQQQVPQVPSQLGGKVAKALEKAEARKQKRLARQAQWDELYGNKPDENYQDPKDVAAIKEAREKMGDYKLKTAKDYVVPESQRVNAEKKRLQLLNLLEQIHQYKFGFNQRFLALREKKIRIIKEIKEAVVNLEKLQRHLDPFAKQPIPKVPEMNPDECPERRLEYTRKKLLEFKKEMEEKASQSHQDDGGGFGGFGGFGGGAGAGGGENKLAPPGGRAASFQKDHSLSSLSLHSTSRPRSSLSAATGKGTPDVIEEEEKLTPLERQIQYEEQIRLGYDQDVILDTIKSMLDEFDAELRTLHHDKLHLEVALKSADLRQVTLFEEYMLLKEFEKRENIYANKVDSKFNEKEEMQDKVEVCEMKLDEKKQEIEKLQEQEKALYATFTTSLGENNKFENFLTRVFKKKIKRAKKKAQTDEGSDEDSEDEDSDEELTSSDEDDSDAEDLDDSVCAPGCDQSLFDQVCQLREKRLDLEELLFEERRSSDALKKEYDALVKKAKVIQSALQTAEADLEAFQREKQQKLNELDVVVVLRLHQVQHMVNGFIPQDLSPCLVFNGKEMVRLTQRIKGLEKEKAEQKRLYREHRQTHVQLIRDKKGLDARIEELEGKVKDMQMLKFGRLVDLDKLETVSVNRTVEELKEKLRQEELWSTRVVAKWDNAVDSYKEKVTQLTRENTQRLGTYTVLLQEKKELEHQLDSRQKSLGTEFSGARKADLRERQRLVQLVQLQAQEIDALKDEITLLSRKGGHILPPAQPPLPPGHTPIPNQS